MIDIDLSFSQTVPCEIAHRRQLGEVFVADSAQVDRDEFALAVQVPRAHALWGDRRVPVHETLASAEAARQAVFVVLHRHLGVPLGLPFTLQRFTFHVTDLAAYADDEATPFEGVLRYRVRNRHALDSLDDGLGVLTLRGDLTVGSRAAMTVSAEIVSMPAEDYGVLHAVQKARAAAGAVLEDPVTTTVAPALVGRHDERNVVVGEPVHADGRTTAPLVLDQRHPAFFDHAYDHLPGPVAVEGLRQTALLAAVHAGALPSPVSSVTLCEVEFSAFGFLDERLDCSAEVTGRTDDGDVLVAVAMHQFGKQIIDGRIAVRPTPGG